jgi:hypothetical protein
VTKWTGADIPSQKGETRCVFAATSPDAKPAGYYGPNGIFELKGAVAPAVVSLKAKDVAVAQRLWQVSEELTGVRVDRATLLILTA